MFTHCLTALDPPPTFVLLILPRYHGMLRLSQGMSMNFGQEGGLLVQGCIFLIVGLFWWKGAHSAAKPPLTEHRSPASSSHVRATNARLALSWHDHRSEVFEPGSFKQNELGDAAVILTPEAHTGKSASLLS
jgi:hypothetical protein